MKRLILTILCMVACTGIYAQVKTYTTVYADEIMLVNASDCKENSAAGYKIWVRYDYKDTKFCKQAAKEDGVKGKVFRSEVLYEFDETLLQYRIISKVYFDKKDKIIKRLDYYDIPWNSIGDSDYSQKLGSYLTSFGIVAG